jgi:hypothetical protein
MPRIDAERVELAAAQSGAVAVPDGQNVDDIIKAREAAIDRLTNQLNSAQRVDIAYTIAAVAAVFAFSWAPMHFAAHRQLRRAERRKNAAEAERDAAIEAQEAFTSRITTRLAEAADFAGHDPNSVNRPPTGPAPIAPPPRPDPPRRPHAATRPDDEASRIAVIDDFQTDPPAGHPPAGPDLFDQFPKGDT